MFYDIYEGDYAENVEAGFENDDAQWNVCLSECDRVGNTIPLHFVPSSSVSHVTHCQYRTGYSYRLQCSVLFRSWNVYFTSGFEDSLQRFTWLE